MTLFLVATKRTMPTTRNRPWALFAILCSISMSYAGWFIYFIFSRWDSDNASQNHFDVSGNTLTWMWGHVVFVLVACGLVGLLVKCNSHMTYRKQFFYLLAFWVAALGWQVFGIWVVYDWDNSLENFAPNFLLDSNY